MVSTTPFAHKNAVSGRASLPIDDGPSLVGFASVYSGRQIESDESESSFAIEGIFKSDDVLVALGASLELEASMDAKILVIDFHVSMISAVAAVQPF